MKPQRAQGGGSKFLINRYLIFSPCLLCLSFDNTEKKEGIMKNHSVVRGYGLLALLIITLITFCIPAPVIAQAKPIKAILNVPWGPETAVGLQHKDFVDLVAEKAKGRLQIDPYYSSSLYGLDQQTPMLQKNVIQFGAQSGWYWH